MTPQNLAIHATDAAQILAIASAAQADFPIALADCILPAEGIARPDWWLQGWQVIELCQQALELAARRGRTSA